MQPSIIVLHTAGNLQTPATYARVNGFSLHAHTQVPAHRRDQLARLLRYMARGALALERLQEDANGDLVYTFTKPWSDGTRGFKLSPVELLEKLTALVPLPRVRLVRYGGCLAPPSMLRSAILPTPHQQGVDGCTASTGSPRWSWARLLKRVCALEMATCPFCQRGSRRSIAAITPEAVITRILSLLCHQHRNRLINLCSLRFHFTFFATLHWLVWHTAMTIKQYGESILSLHCQGNDSSGTS